MTRMIAYSATDMSSFDVFYGQVEESSDTRIVIGDGAHSTIYGGEFYYTYEGDVFGELRTVEQALGRTTLWEAWDIDRDAHAFSLLLAAGNSEGAKAFVLSGADELTGSSGADVLQGYAGADTITGGDGSDELEGGRGADLLIGGIGRDILNGGVGADVMSGGAGGDQYVIDDARDVVLESGGGFDRIFATVSMRLPQLVEAMTLVGPGLLAGVGNPLDNAIIGGDGADRLSGLGGADWLSGGLGNDVALGGPGDDRLYGNAGDDSLVDGAGADALSGGPGRDVLRGGAGNDTLSGDWGGDVLVGGAGADLLSGGAGNDTFRFLSSADIGRGSGADTIEDFTTGDRIDLRAIDADEATPGIQAFDFIESARFSGEAGELRFWAGRLMADTDGDGLIEFGLLLPATDEVMAENLIL